VRNTPGRWDPEAGAKEVPSVRTLHSSGQVDGVEPTDLSRERLRRREQQDPDERAIALLREHFASGNQRTPDETLERMAEALGCEVRDVAARLEERWSRMMALAPAEFAA
jgi:hypothetical protein